MAISAAMLAQALLEFLQAHTKDFEEFSLDRWNIDDGQISFGENGTKKRLLCRVTRRAQDGGTLAEDEYAITIERLGREREGG